MLQNDPHGYLHWQRKSMRQLVTFLWSDRQTLPGDTTQTFATPWGASSPSPFLYCILQMSWTCKSSSKCQVCNARARGSWAAAATEKQQHLQLSAWCLNSKWKWKYADCDVSCDVDVDSDCAAQLSAKSCQLLLSKRRLLLLFALLLLLLFVLMLLLGWPHKKQQQRTLGGKAKRLVNTLTAIWKDNS